MAAILNFPVFAKNGKTQICFYLLNRAISSKLSTLLLDNFDEIALSHMIKEIEANLCFAIFGKNSKIQNGCHFWGGENFLKIPESAFLR